MFHRRLFLTALASAVASPALAKDTDYIDLMADFWPVYDKTHNAPDRASALLAGFFTPHADVYAGAGVKLSEERITKWLPQFDPTADDVRRLWRHFPRQFRKHNQHFAQFLPDFDSNRAPIYVMPSLYNFDGHLQPWEGKVPLFLGLDGIIKYHGARTDLSVLLDHESFHLYQAQAYPEQSLDATPQVYVALWMEGCATYVSGLMNPKASRVNVLLDDAELTQVTPETVQVAIADLLTCLESRDDKDYGRFFYANYKSSIPSRMGYLIGFMVAERSGKTMTPAEMARVPNDQLLVLVRDVLKTL